MFCGSHEAETVRGEQNKNMKQPFYQDEFITIFHGDCRHILPHLGNFDLLLTDPPYGITFAGQPTKWQRRAGQKAEEWDNDTVEEWVLLLARQLCRTAIIWGGNYYSLPPSRCWLSWFKPDAPPSMGNVEYAWTNMDKNSRQISQSIGATNSERLGHPTQKPLRVIEWALAQAEDIETIVDPYGGSGTTGRAAKNMGKKCVLIEREEKYCEMAAKRMAQEVLCL